MAKSKGPRCEEGFACVLGNCPKPDGFVNRPRNYLLHIDQYHKVTMRWYCEECEKYFF